MSGVQTVEVPATYHHTTARQRHLPSRPKKVMNPYRLKLAVRLLFHPKLKP
jgi:hypothetical protein